MIFGEGPIIKNIAGDLNKLFLQGSRVGQPITNVEGDAAADQGTVDLLAAMDPVIQEISVGMSGEEAMQYTVSGTPPLTLTDSLGMPLRSWSVELSPYQNLNGYDAPWPAGGGVNKFDESTVSYGKWISSTGSLSDNDAAIISSFIPVSSETTCTFRLYGEMPYSMAIVEYSAADQSSFIKRSFASRPSTYISATFDENTKYVQVEVSASSSPTDVITPELLASYQFVLYFGSTAPSSWIPYSNICPILGTDKLNLFVEESYDPSAAPTAAITLPQTVYHGTVGSEGGTPDSGAVDLGTLTWLYDPGNAVFYANIPDKDHSTAECNVMCEAYKQYPNNGTSINVGQVMDDFSITGFYYPASQNSWIYLKNTSYTTPAALKTSLQGIKCVYQLTTPGQFAVTAPDISTPRGTAAAWATAENGTVDSMEVTYIGKP